MAQRYNLLGYIFSNVNIYYIIIVVNDMKKLNNNGFTLIELIVTIVLLVLVVSISSYSITEVIKRAKEEDYKLLIENINSAVHEYYIECKYGNDDITCQNEITLKYLVDNGYLKGNSTDSDDKFTLVNPKDNKNISSCNIKYTYSDGKISVVAVNPTGSCPTSY